MLSAFTVIPKPDPTSNVGLTFALPLCVKPAPAVTLVTVPNPDSAIEILLAAVILPCASTVISAAV